MDNDVLYTLEQMDEIFDGLELKSIIMKGGNEYQIILSDMIKKDLEDGIVTLNSLECSLLNISDSIFRKIGNEDFLYDSKETNMRLVLSRQSKVLEVLVARPIAKFAIY